jgi:F-box and leucine-rich repeat protein 2/20
MIAANSDDHSYLKSLSVFSKQLLSLTNHHKFSLTISNQTLPFLPRLFQRFTNLTSLDISSYYGDHNKLLIQISGFPLKLTSLNLSNQPVIPANGLRVFSQKITTLTSLTCSNIGSIYSTDIRLITDCFPLLQELDLSYPTKFISHTNRFLVGVEALSLTLLKLLKVNLSGHYYINNSLVYDLFKNCKHLEEAFMLDCDQITNADVVASALRERPILRSLYYDLLTV